MKKLKSKPSAPGKFKTLNEDGGDKDYVEAPRSRVPALENTTRARSSDKTAENGHGALIGRGKVVGENKVSVLGN